jgi:mono/diheme cytochrome c family protein
MKVSIAALFISLLFWSGTAHAQDIGDARKGQQIAETVCAECHAVGAAQSSSLSARAPAFSAIANTPGMTETALTVWFRTPHPTMPNLILSAEDIDHVIAYILGLRTRK